mgnify:FL=1
MKLLVEAGGTKCKWGLASNGETVIETSGFNPNCSSIDNLQELAITVKMQIGYNIDSILYFGAGCSNSKSKTEIADTLSSIFKCSKVNVHTDLEGSAIALFGKESGISAILGTGASAGFFNGNEIVKQSPSLGYLLGDEGRGAYLGKTLIAKILRNEMSTDLCNNFLSKYNITPSDLIKSVYSSSPTNGYLASYVPFISHNIDNKQMSNLVEESFQLFHEKHIEPIANLSNKIGFVGGIAFQFSDILRKIYADKGFEIRILKDAFGELMNAV